MQEHNRVGVDVSAKKLVVAIEASGRREAPIVLSNDADGHRKLIKLATKRGALARVVLESTGTYGLDLALALHRSNRIEVMVANPRAITHFARASLQRSKADRLDAVTILGFALRMTFVPWSPPGPLVLELRALSRRIEASSKTVVQEKNRLHANDQSEALSEFVKQDIRELVDQLADRIAALRKQALLVIEQADDLVKAFPASAQASHVRSRSSYRSSELLAEGRSPLSSASRPSPTTAERGPAIDASGPAARGPAPRSTSPP